MPRTDVGLPLNNADVIRTIRMLIELDVNDCRILAALGMDAEAFFVPTRMNGASD